MPSHRMLQETPAQGIAATLHRGNISGCIYNSALRRSIDGKSFVICSLITGQTGAAEYPREYSEYPSGSLRYC